MSHSNRSKLNPSAAANPNPEEIRRVREAARLTQDQAGALVHTGRPTWAKWEAAIGVENSRRMHPATWELFNAKFAINELLKNSKLTPAGIRRMGIHLPT